MKSILDKVYELNELMREIEQLESRKRILNKYIDYMNRNEIDHIGFDCSNTTHIIRNENELNEKVVDLLMNHYKNEIKEIDYNIELLKNKISYRLR